MGMHLLWPEDLQKTDMIFRLSHKLNNKIKADKLNELPLHENPFADWSCHLFTANRRQYILLSNTKTLYSCVLPGKGIANETQFIKRALTVIRDFTADDARQLAFRKYIAPASEDIQFGTALNRSVTGSMNQLVEYAQDLLIENCLTPDEVGFKLNDLLLSALSSEKSRGYDTPARVFQTLVDESLKNEHRQQDSG